MTTDQGMRLGCRHAKAHQERDGTRSQLLNRSFSAAPGYT